MLSGAINAISSGRNLPSPSRVARGLLVGCLTLLLGCGTSGPEMVPISGTITFDGGTCPAAGTIIFSPIEVDPGATKRPGTGRFDKDGRFTVTSFRDGDGLYCGRYRVRIQCNRGLPAPEPGGMERVTYIAPGYEPDELVVETGSDAIEVNYDVPLKK